MTRTRGRTQERRPARGQNLARCAWAFSSLAQARRARAPFAASGARARVGFVRLDDEHELIEKTFAFGGGKRRKDSLLMCGNQRTYGLAQAAALGREADQARAAVRSVRLPSDQAALL